MTYLQALLFSWRSINYVDNGSHYFHPKVIIQVDSKASLLCTPRNFDPSFLILYSSSMYIELWYLIKFFNLCRDYNTPKKWYSPPMSHSTVSNFTPFTISQFQWHLATSWKPRRLHPYISRVVHTLLCDITNEGN